MRSWLRDFLQNVRDAREDLFVVWLALAAFLVGGCKARAEGVPEVEARAALALAKAKRERVSMACFTDLAKAEREARSKRKPLVLWIGVTCADHPQLRHDLADAVHCHVKERDSDPTPRVMIEGTDGKEYYVLANRIGKDTAERIREKWER